jgi:hypothetical protein
LVSALQHASSNLKTGNIGKPGGISIKVQALEEVRKINACGFYQDLDFIGLG